MVSTWSALRASQFGPATALEKEIVDTVLGLGLGWCWLGCWGKRLDAALGWRSDESSSWGAGMWVWGWGWARAMVLVLGAWVPTVVGLMPCCWVV